MSHEPATPPRGGSAAAEIQALRRTFGESASKIIITNTKGFTGHPMGTGIEDSVSIRGLCQGEFPPIANFKQPDPELGDLRLSVGGPVDVEYVVRHAAGFGSQMAFTMVRRIANNLERLDRSRIANWTAKVVGGNTDLRILDRKLVAYINPDEKIIGGVQGEPWAFVESEEPKPELISPSKPVMIEEVAQVKSPPQPANDVSSKVVEVVVKHTGYPEDFIELDQDLEGELGIDTVKQAEIMAELRDFYNLPVDESFVLSEHPTLNHMIAYLGQDESEPEIEEAIPVEPVTHQLVTEETPVQAEPEKMGVRRWQVEVEESPPEATTPLEIEGRVVAVTDDPWGVADTLCHILEAAGIDTVRIMLDPSIVSKVKIEKDGPVDIIRVDPGNHEQLAEVSAHLAKVGEVVALLHLSPLRLAGVGWETETQQAQLTSTTHGLFGLLKSLDTQLSSIKDGTVMSVSAMDGRHGNASNRFNALAAGAHGIVKSYAKEKPHLRCRAVDIDPELLADPTALAHQIWAEAFGRTSPLEVGLSRDGNRWALRLYEEDLPHEIQSLQSDDVWVVSGGGAGVTARCIVGVAESSRNAGATFILLGRTKLDASIEQWLQDDEEALQKRKMNLREEMIAESESGKVTMVEWDREWNQKIRSFEIHKTILEIQATGNRALYDACDVTNSKSVSKVLTAVRKECGSITGIVHGAGLEDSKLVADKSWEKFNQIISVKIDGWRALIDAIGDDLHQLRTLCAFTSIAGRFGNGGQVDYAAANNILDAEMCRISHHEDAPRAVAIAWSGWRDVGMATRGSLESVFLQAGIETIPVDIGVEIFTHEMLAGGKRRVVAAGALGILDDEDCKRAPPQKFPADTAGALSEPERFPFVDRILEHDQYAEILTECTLSTDRFPFLVDHSIAGTPYHPGVMAMEMFAQSSLLLYPMCILEGFSEIKFGLPIKLIKEETRIRVRAKYFDQDHNSLFIKCHIESDLVNSNGEIFGEPRIHHEGIVRLLKEGASRDSEVAFSDSPGRGKASFQPNFIYDRFFHGPRFQVHGGMIKGVSDGDDLGVDGIALLRNQLPNSQLFDQEPALLESLPMLIEACFQNAGMVAMEVDGISSLPIGIEECEVLKVPATRDELRVRSYRRAEEEGGVTVHDAMVFDRNQKPIVSLKGLRLKGMAPVPEELQFSLKRKGK